MNSISKPKLLLHVCCGVCSSWIVEQLTCSFEVTIFFFNPNIHPEEEFRTRLNDTKRVAVDLGVEVIEGKYIPEDWFGCIKGYESEPEGGSRCELCFDFRLNETARKAREGGYDFFGTTLTIGRNKKVSVINPIGAKIGCKHKINFLSGNFKKYGGLEKSYVCSDEMGIVRQDYCGCVFSQSHIKS